MNKLLVYAVYDSAVKAYMQPFFMQTKGIALRSWLEAANDDKTQFHKHPGDFTLFELAEYDEMTGQFTNHLTPQSLGTALEHKKTEQPAFDYKQRVINAVEAHSERITQ